MSFFGVKWLVFYKTSDFKFSIAFFVEEIYCTKPSVVAWYKGTGSTTPVPFYFSTMRDKEKLHNNYERAIFFKEEEILPREHARYEWASQFIKNGDRVLEIGCSN